jgi:hypothetical protein
MKDNGDLSIYNSVDKIPLLGTIVFKNYNVLQAPVDVKQNS